MSARELTALGRLLEAARTGVLHISGREAARRSGITEARWRQVVTGVQSRGAGVRVPVNPRANTVVAMALAVHVDPAEALAAAGIEIDPASVAGLVEEVRQSLASRDMGPSDRGDEVADEIDRIRRLPISAQARRRMIETVLAVYEEETQERRQQSQPRSG